MALTAEPIIPTFTIGDRMQKALDASETTVAGMAIRLGVSRQTVGNYLAGRTKPKLATLRVWADVTGVPVEWLTTGRDDMIPAQLRLSFASAH